MKLKVWLVLLLIIITVFVFFKVSVYKNELVGFNNINEENYMKIESSVFTNNGNIPMEYTCYGNRESIPLTVSNILEEAESLAFIVDDPDAPGGDFVHWVLWNIDPKISMIESKNVPVGAKEGYTSLNKPGWVAPCPPSGIHHYYFKLYALDTILSIPESSNKKNLISAMEGHILGSTILVGLYGKG